MLFSAQIVFAVHFRKRGIFMFDSFLVKAGSLENFEENGKIAGFRFAVRIADYRGAWLSLHNGYYIEVDGTVYPRDLQRFEINGKAPRDFEEIKKASWEHWDYDDYSIVWVYCDGGLALGTHRLGLQQSVLAQYGYMPHDQAWIDNPPVPGSGAGAGKTTNICYYDLELK